MEILEARGMIGSSDAAVKVPRDAETGCEAGGDDGQVADEDHESEEFVIAATPSAVAAMACAGPAPQPK